MTYLQLAVLPILKLEDIDVKSIDKISQLVLEFGFTCAVGFTGA